MNKNKKFIPRQYKILVGQEWKSISWRKGRELELSNDYISIELFDENDNYRAQGLMKNPNPSPKFENLEKGLNELMNKYNNKK
jgi:hypothetical protein